MAGTLQHSPADVTARLLADLGVGTLLTSKAVADALAAGVFGLKVDEMPTFPDNVIVLRDTDGRGFGRFGWNGEQQESHGILFNVRATDFKTGWRKANALSVVLDQSIYQNTVTVEGVHYVVYQAARTTRVLRLGEEPGSKRVLFSLNALLNVRQAT